MQLLAGDGMVFAILAVTLIPAAIAYAIFRYAERHSADWNGWRRYTFLPIKWFLIAMGAFIAAGMALQELREHRIGLGTGIATTVLLATIKGVTNAITGHTPGSPSGHERPPLAH